MNLFRRLFVLVLCAISLGLIGCSDKQPEYGTETPLNWPGHKRQVWAVAPAVNLSGQKQVDPLLQADLVYQQLQEVMGITAIPVNRVVEVYASLQIEKVQSEEQAQLVCDLLGCDALVVPTVTAFDPYNPPKFGASLQLFAQPGTFARPASVDVRDLARRATPGTNASVRQPQQGSFYQSVAMCDAANGTIRQALLDYAQGRHDPGGPLGSKEYFVNMDRYCGFVYHELVGDLIFHVGRR